MKRWYHNFYTIYSKSKLIREMGIYCISTKEERKIHKQCKKNKKILKKVAERNLWKNTESKLQYDLCIVAIMKNEGSYIKEWIEFHKLVGVQLFVLYDHDSTDNTYEILKPYIEEGTVIYKFVSTPNSKLHHPQEEMYTDAVVHFRDRVRWMAFIDIDEFIVPETYGKQITNVIDDIVRDNPKVNIGGIGINWLLYGSSNYLHRPSGLVIENYYLRAKDTYMENNTIKTIANPRRIISCGIHTPVYIDGFININENGDEITGCMIKNSHSKIRINHYASKSKAEAEERRKKGFGGSRVTHLSHDYNDCFDNIMKDYVDFLETESEMRR